MNLSRLTLYLIPAALFADPGFVQFNRDVRPILSDKCYTCHGPDAANRKTKVRFDTEDGVKAAASEIVKRVTSGSKTLRMPPGYMGRDPLSASEIDTLKRWLDQGAPWESHWSFIPPKPSPGASIDSLVLARLKREGLGPSPEAGRATLIRRVSLDLTGIPPLRPRWMRLLGIRVRGRMRRWSIGCWLRLGTGRRWRSGGWMRRGMRIRMGISRMGTGACGAGGIG